MGTRRPQPEVHADWDEIYRELGQHLEQRSPDDEGSQELIHQHYQIACRFYTPSREAYIGMALLYRENEDMLRFHNGYHPDMVEFLIKAITIFAQHSGRTHRTGRRTAGEECHE